MAWYQEAIFYHIYPLGLCGAPKQNAYEAPVHRLPGLNAWIDHIAAMNCTALYIGPLFESVGHGYETTDYYRLDSRLGDNDDLKAFVKYCHDKGLKVIFDGVFNHVGRDFFAFRDLQANRENSRYRDWFCNVNFWNNNEYNDGFSYDNWGGYNLLVKLNQRNPEVQDYICNVVKFWAEEFDVDGIRLDAADVLDFGFMRGLRWTANQVKPDFWLMGEVIHGEYSRWVNGETLHSVTNYSLHKALYSGHNEHNYFEIAHTVKRLQNMGELNLYNFVDNHDVARIASKLNNPAHFVPVHVLEYTLPGVPSIYYGSEFAIEGPKHRYTDDNLRPCLRLEDYAGDWHCEFLTALGKVRKNTPALSYGSYQELKLTNRQYVFARDLDGVRVIAAVNNDDTAAWIDVPAGNSASYVGALSGKKCRAENGNLHLELEPNSGEIWIPEGDMPAYTPVKLPEKKAEKPAQQPAKDWQNQAKAAPAPKKAEKPLPKADFSKSPEEMSVEELQAAILAKMAANGPVTEQMKKTVTDNIWHNSLVNWLRSFR